MRRARAKNEVENVECGHWGNPVDVPNDDFERHFLKQNILERDENERAVLIKSFNFPMRNRLKGEFLSGKSKKIMSISTLRPTRQRSRRRRRQHVDLHLSADCSLEGHYNFIENSSSLQSRGGGTRRRKPRKPTKGAVADKQSSTLKAVQKSGLVNTKISIYEKNLSCANNNCKQSRTSKRKKTVLGVPLIGMRESEPIVAASSDTWKNYGTKDPLQLYITGGKSLRKPRERSTTKRKAPSIPNSASIAVPASISKAAAASATKDDETANELKSSSVNTAASYPIKFTRNPYLIAKDEESRQARDLHQFRGSAKAPSQSAQKTSTFVRSSSQGGKRKTLYAKDTDRDEVIRVLTNLCLNPLARNNKRASFMMW